MLLDEVTRTFGALLNNVFYMHYIGEAADQFADFLIAKMEIDERVH